jgi:hypothetical protein
MKNRLFLFLFMVSVFGGLCLSAQALSPEAARKQLAGKWRVSKERTLKVMSLCGQCNDASLLKQIDEMEQIVIQYSAKGTTKFKGGEDKTSKGTYTLETERDTMRICPGMAQYGTVFLMVQYDRTHPDHGDRMHVVFIDRNTLCILDVGCPIAIVRAKRKH